MPKDLTAVLLPAGQLTDETIRKLVAERDAPSYLRVVPLSSVGLIQVEIHEGAQGLPAEDPERHADRRQQLRLPRSRRRQRRGFEPHGAACLRSAGAARAVGLALGPDRRIIDEGAALAVRAAIAVSSGDGAAAGGARRATA